MNAMDTITVAQLPEYLARIVVMLRKVDSNLDRCLQEEEEAELPDEDDLMDIFQLRDYLPGNPKLGTVRGWMYYQQVPNYKFGKRVYFSKKAINKWIREHIERDDIECFRGLPEEDLVGYPVVEDDE